MVYNNRYTQSRTPLLLQSAEMSIKISLPSPSYPMASSSPLDCNDVASKYIERILGVEHTQMKALVLDKDTSAICSLVKTQSQILSRGVYLTTSLESLSSKQNMAHLACYLFVRPTKVWIQLEF